MALPDYAQLITVYIKGDIKIAYFLTLEHLYKMKWNCLQSKAKIAKHYRVNNLLKTDYKAEIKYKT